MHSGAAARGGGEGAATGAESRRGAGRESEAAREGLAGAGTRRPARRQWLARRRRGALLKARSHSWGFLWPMGGGRAGRGGAVWVPLSAPRCLAHNFSASEVLGGGVRAKSGGKSLKNRCPPTQPWRTREQRFGPGSQCEQPERRRGFSLQPPPPPRPQTLRGTFRQTHLLEYLGDG